MISRAFLILQFTTVAVFANYNENFNKTSQRIKVKRYIKDTADTLMKDLMDRQKAKIEILGSKFAEMTYTFLKNGPVEFTCTWRNRGTFLASFIELQTKDKKAYTLIVGLKNDGKIKWADNPSSTQWPKTFLWKTKYSETARTEKPKHGIRSLILDASRKTCETEQGKYKCSVFAKWRNKVIFQAAIEEWITPECLSKFDPNATSRWGEAPRTTHLNDFVFMFSRTAGNKLTKSTVHIMANLTSGCPERVVGRRGNQRVMTFAMRRTCAPTKLTMERAMKIQAIVIFVKQKNKHVFVPVIGINEHNQIMWSPNVGWQRSYPCKKTSCTAGAGKINMKDPYLYLYTTKMSEAKLPMKCQVYVRFTGSPVTEIVINEGYINEKNCKYRIERAKKKAKKAGPKYLSGPNLDEWKVVEAVTTPALPITEIAVGSSVGGVALILFIVLMCCTWRNMKNSREKEMLIIQKHREKMMLDQPELKKSSRNIEKDLQDQTKKSSSSLGRTSKQSTRSIRSIGKEPPNQTRKSSSSEGHRSEMNNTYLNLTNTKSQDQKRMSSSSVGRRSKMKYTYSNLTNTKSQDQTKKSSSSEGRRSKMKYTHSNVTNTKSQDQAKKSSSSVGRRSESNRWAAEKDPQEKKSLLSSRITPSELTVTDSD